MNLKHSSWRKRLVIAAALCIAATTFAREMGYVRLQAYKYKAETMSSISSNTDRGFTAWLPAANGGFPLELPGHPGVTLQYRDDRKNPLSRWLPLFKTGRTTINRVFVLQRNGTPVLGGIARWDIQLRVMGLCSAAGYTQLAVPPEDFLALVEREMNKAGLEN